MNSITFSKSWLIAVVLAAALVGCNSSNAEAPSLDIPAEPAAVVGDHASIVPVTVADDFVPTADAVNLELSHALYDAKPFIDETMPNDNQMQLSSSMQAAAICRQEHGSIDDTLLPFPVLACTQSQQGYPIYMLKCNLQTRECINTVDRIYVGTVEEVAPQLTVVSNADVLNDQFICDKICIDGADNVVGAVQPEMQDWLNGKTETQ